MGKINKKFAGFTLIELLVVIVIIGVLATISVSTFGNYIEKARLAKAQVFAKQFENTILREGAIDEKKILTAWFKGDSMADYARNVPDAYTPYSFPTPLNDNSGLGNHLTHGKSFLDSDTPLPKGSSIRFNYNNGPYRLYTVINRPVDQITIATWVKYEELHRVFGWRATRPVWFSNACNLEAASNAKICFNLDWFGVEGRVCSSKSMKKNRWHHIVASYNRDTQIMRIWLDGDLTKRVGVVYNNSISGNSTMRTGYGFAGKLDEVMISPYAFNGENFN